MGIRTIEQVKAELTNEPQIETKFKVGDKVTFTNEYGLTFPGLRIIGFDKGNGSLFKYGKHIYLDTSAYWFPHAESELTLES